MTAHTDFEGMARAAAAMNAEAAFDRCLAGLRSDERSNSAGRLAFFKRTLDMSKTDADLEWRARSNAISYLIHQTDPDERYYASLVKHIRWVHSNDQAVVAAFPEKNQDITAAKTPRDETGWAYR